MWKPRIFRYWNFRTGKFIWAYTTPRANSWTNQTLCDARRMERQAAAWCRGMNTKG
jgi:hypothetical protein